MYEVRLELLSTVWTMTAWSFPGAYFYDAAGRRKMPLVKERRSLALDQTAEKENGGYEKIMRKKVFSVLLASAIAAAALAGCGQSGQTEKTTEAAKEKTEVSEKETKAASEKKDAASEKKDADSEKADADEKSTEKDSGKETKDQKDDPDNKKGTVEQNTDAAEDGTSTEAESAKADTPGKDKEEEKDSAKGDFKIEKLVIGFDQDFPPMGFIGDDGEYTGFDLDLAAEVADRLGAEVVYQPIAWDAKDMELESGNIDCIWNGFTMTGREDGYTWSEPYMKNDQVFVVRADSGISSRADLAGKVVDVQTDSSAQRALAEMNELTASFASLNPVADYNTAFMELEAGAVDVIAMDAVVANYQIEKRGAEFVVLDEAIAAEEYAVGFKKGNEQLRDAVQEKLNEMAEDGTLTEISNEWFGKDMTILGK